MPKFRNFLKKKQEATAKATATTVKQGQQVVDMNVEMDKSYERVLGTLDDNIRALERMKKEKAALDTQAKKSTKTNIELEKRISIFKGGHFSNKHSYKAAG